MYEQIAASNPFENNKETGRAFKLERPKFESVLTEYDQKYVERGLEALKEDFENVPEKNFPDLLIFMDTGARPLAAGVLPIAKAVAERRGLKTPANRFLAGGFRHHDLRKLEAARQSGDPDWKERFVLNQIAYEKGWRTKTLADDIEQRREIGEWSEDYFSSIGKTKEGVLAKWDAGIERDKSKLANIEERVRVEMEKLIRDEEGNARAMRERLKDILSSTKAKNATIVDDYLSQGVTLSQLLNAFRSLDKERRPNITFMSFFGKQSPTNLGDDSDLQNPQYELRAEQEKRAWIEEGFQVLLPSQEYNEYSGFIYSHKVDWMRSSLEDIKSELKKSFVGVEKISGQAIAKVAGERDQKLMLQLRHEMRDIADKILKK